MSWGISHSAGSFYVGHLNITLESLLRFGVFGERDEVVGGGEASLEGPQLRQAGFELAFMELLGKHGIRDFDYPLEDLQEELRDN